LVLRTPAQVVGCRAPFCRRGVALPRPVRVRQPSDRVCDWSGCDYVERDFTRPWPTTFRSAATGRLVEPPQSYALSVYPLFLTASPVSNWRPSL